MKILISAGLIAFLSIFIFTNKAISSENIKSDFIIKIGDNSKLKSALLNNKGKENFQVFHRSCGVDPTSFNMANCKALFIRYYFDTTSQSCKEIEWGGCPDEPPFITMQQCQNHCGVIKKRNTRNIRNTNN